MSRTEPDYQPPEDRQCSICHEVIEAGDVCVQRHGSPMHLDCGLVDPGYEAGVRPGDGTSAW